MSTDRLGPALRDLVDGVEDDEQVRLLRELGCDQIQGFYVSHPVPADQIVPLLRGLEQKRMAAA